MKPIEKRTPDQQKPTLFKEAKSFQSFSVNDLQKAKQFYGQTLGLEVTESPEGLEMQLESGYRVFIYPKPNHSPASFTILNFVIDDIDEAVEELGKLGVKLEHYNEPNLKTDQKGIFRGPGPKIAWFKDPAQNILSVLEPTR